MNGVSPSQRFSILRFLEVAPNLGRIISSRVAEIESVALSIGIDYSREPGSGGNRLPKAVSVVERLEGDRTLRAARELKDLFDRVWPMIRSRHGEAIRNNVWCEPPGDPEGVGLEAGRWTEHEERACLADTWNAICAVLGKKAETFTN